MRCTFERECSAQTILSDEKQKNRVFGKYEYRKMGVSIEEHGWGWRLARTLLLIGKIFPGIILGICNFSGYVKSIKVLAREISTGKERNIHYIRTFSENGPRLKESVAFLSSAVRISTLPKNYYGADCHFVLQYDDGFKHSISHLQVQNELVDRIGKLTSDLFDSVTQKRASLQKIYMLALVADNAAKTTFSIAKVEYNAVTSNDSFFSCPVAADKVPSLIKAIDPNKHFFSQIAL